MTAIPEKRQLLREELAGADASGYAPGVRAARPVPALPEAGLDALRARTVLVFAPHPDDEALAIGGILNRLVNAGSRLHVVFLTNGENNGLVQRFVERRLLLDADARGRWGERRRRESKAALARLGLVDSDSRFLGFPDGTLMKSRPILDEAVQDELDEVRPDLILSPSRVDLHSDHRATSLAVRLALSRQAHPARLYEYMVHGWNRHSAAVTVELDPIEIQCKREAILCHASQLTLSKRRFLGYAGSAEYLFEPLDDRPPLFVPLRRAIEILRG